MVKLILFIISTSILTSCRKPNIKVSINGQLINSITSAPLSHYQITISSTIRVKGGMGQHSQSINKKPIISDPNGNFTSIFEVSPYSHEREYIIQDSFNNAIFTSTITGNIGTISITP